MNTSFNSFSLAFSSFCPFEKKKKTWNEKKILTGETTVEGRPRHVANGLACHRSDAMLQRVKALDTLISLDCKRRRCFPLSLLFYSANSPAFYLAHPSSYQGWMLITHLYYGETVFERSARLKRERKKEMFGKFKARSGRWVDTPGRSWRMHVK